MGWMPFFVGFKKLFFISDQPTLLMESNQLGVDKMDMYFIRNGETYFN